MSIRRAGRALLRIIGEWNIGGLSPREGSFFDPLAILDPQQQFYAAPRPPIDINIMELLTKAPARDRAAAPLYLADGRVYLREGEVPGTAELLFVSDDGQSRAMPLPPATVSRWLEKLAAINARRG